MSEFLRRLKLLSLTLGVVALSACGGGGSGGNTPSANSNAVTLSGTLTVTGGDTASRYTVVNSNQTVAPTSAGSFSIAVANDKPTYTYAVSEAGDKVYAAVSTSADTTVTINAQTTAEALVLLNPLLIPTSSTDRAAVIRIVKADPAVQSLATVLSSVYGSAATPMADSRFADALTNAVVSVLTTWHTSTGTSTHVQFRQTNQPAGVALVKATSSTPSLQIIGSDMGALTLANSSGTTLRLELANTGPLGATTNVDWVVRIVELDPAKIQTTGANLGYPSSINGVDDLILSGGYDLTTVVEGAVAAGWLKWAVDPFGSTVDAIGATVFPADGITLPHDGTYAVIALSGTKNGGIAGTSDFGTVENSPWQRDLAAEALGLNVGAVALDVLGVGTDFLEATSGGSVPIASIMQSSLMTMIGGAKVLLSTNPGQVTFPYVVGQVKILVDTLLDGVKSSGGYAAVSDPAWSGLKYFVSNLAVKSAEGVLGVWSGSINSTTRIAEFLYGISPKESAYAVLNSSTQPMTPAFTVAFNSTQATFDASSSSAPGATIASYTWNFGDGGSARGSHAVHTYTSADGGPWAVALTITDTLGRTATTTRNIVASCPSGQALQNGQCVSAPPSNNGAHVASAGNVSLVVRSDGSLWVWGLTNNGNLPDVVPKLIGTGFRAVAGGEVHWLALQTDGSLWAWGENEFGELGDGTTTKSIVPRLVGTGYGTMAAGWNYTIALKTDGSLWAWGDNEYGQLGDGTTSGSLVPKLIGTGYSAVATGTFCTQALKPDGSLWAWGSGAIGDGTTTGSLVPKLIGTGYSAIAKGSSHITALKADGSLWAWGANDSGQLGDGSTGFSFAPKLIGTGYSAVATGASHTVALKVDGTLWAWGRNDYGQLGDGTTSGSLVPKLIGMGYSAIAAGNSHTLAVKTDGSVWAWGLNDFAQLGDGTTIDKHVPTLIMQP